MGKSDVIRSTLKKDYTEQIERGVRNTLHVALKKQVWCDCQYRGVASGAEVLSPTTTKKKFCQQPEKLGRGSCFR